MTKTQYVTYGDMIKWKIVDSTLSYNLRAFGLHVMNETVLVKADLHGTTLSHVTSL